MVSDESHTGIKYYVFHSAIRMKYWVCRLPSDGAGHYCVPVFRVSKAYSPCEPPAPAALLALSWRKESPQAMLLDASITIFLIKADGQKIKHRSNVYDRYNCSSPLFFPTPCKIAACFSEVSWEFYKVSVCLYWVVNWWNIFIVYPSLPSTGYNILETEILWLNICIFNMTIRFWYFVQQESWNTIFGRSIESPDR